MAYEGSLSSDQVDFTGASCWVADELNVRQGTVVVTGSRIIAKGLEVLAAYPVSVRPIFDLVGELG